MGVATASADFIVVDDFEDHTIGKLNDNSAWTVVEAKAYDVDTDPKDADNKLISIVKNKIGGSLGHIGYTSASIGEDDTATLFFRLRKDTSDYDNASYFFFGMAESSTPTVENFGMEIEKADLKAGGTDTGTDLLQDGTWQNFWMVIDNDNNTFSLYRTTGTDGAAAADQLASDVAFDTNSTGALSTFVIRTVENKNKDPMMVDDVYLDTSGENLTNPIPEPATMSLLALGGLGVLMRRRRS
jgi:hypothetical protein